MITVGQLAEQLGISLKEAVALCVLSGVQVTGASTTLTPADVARVHDILEGRVHLPDPNVPAKKKAIGERRLKRSRVPTMLTVLAIFMLVSGLVFVLWIFRGNPRVLRAQPGDCFNADLVGLWVIPASVNVVPCDGPHGFRAVATIDLDATYTSWPGIEAVRQQAEQRCPALADASGVNSGTTTILFLGPGDEWTWRDETTHKIICATREKRT